MTRKPLSNYNVFLEKPCWVTKNLIPDPTIHEKYHETLRLSHVTRHISARLVATYFIHGKPEILRDGIVQ